MNPKELVLDQLNHEETPVIPYTLHDLEVHMGKKLDEYYGSQSAWREKIVFWDGLGSQSTIPFGTPTEIKTEIKKLCTEMGRGGGYILAPAKAFQPETPVENAVAVIEAFTSQ